MAEPAGAFWIAHTRLTGSTLDVAAFLKQAHIRPAWINAIHLIAAAGFPDLSQVGFKQEAVIMRWPEPAFSQQRILHAALRTILLGEAEMTLILAQGRNRSAMLVAASHLAVGRYNLFPQAEFVTFSAFNPEDSPLLEQIKTVLDRQLPEGTKTQSLLLAGQGIKRPVKKGSPFESAAWVSSAQAASGIDDCCAVVEVLNSSKKKNGLAVEIETDGLVNFTALERL